MSQKCWLITSDSDFKTKLGTLMRLAAVGMEYKQIILFKVTFFFKLKFYPGPDVGTKQARSEAVRLTDLGGTQCTSGGTQCTSAGIWTVVTETSKQPVMAMNVVIVQRSVVDFTKVCTL
jgi:hypothetical protein